MWHEDPYDNSIVISGWEAGIADSPHSGLSDLRNVNIVSVPGEASVNFSTSQISQPTLSTGTVSSVNSGTDTITYTGATILETGMAVVFSGTVPAGISTGVTYWVGNVSGNTFNVYSDMNKSSLVDITNTTTGATFTGYVMGLPKYFAYDSNLGFYWCVDANGLVWTNAVTTGANQYWVYSGNKANNYSHGNGIVYYQGVSSTGVVTGYIFVFSDSSIDYTLSAPASVSWVYQWDYTAGTTGAYSATPTKTLKSLTGSSNPHEAFVAPDNRVYFTDSTYIGVFYETAPGTAFVPSTIGTYTNSQKALLPGTDIAQCLAFLGTSLLIGGKNNVIYPWDRFSTNFSYPILIAENDIKKMVTVNTNTYVFVGNRGRIYTTNGTNAKLYKKVPDHISGTVEPYFVWGGATNVKNQLYFSCYATDNAGNPINQYGGVWAIDLDTNAIRLTNELSYATYAGYASAIIPNYVASNGIGSAGTGLYIGWKSGVPTYGIDTTSSTPYGSSTPATIDSDLIPIGTFNKPQDFTKIEYRLTKPLVLNERITIKTRLIFNTQDTGYSTTLDDLTVGHYSGTANVNFKLAQWVQFQVVLQSTSFNPSYTRLKEIRVLRSKT